MLTINSNIFDAQKISVNENYGENVIFNKFGNSIIPRNKIDYIFANTGFNVYQHEYACHCRNSFQVDCLFE